LAAVGVLDAIGGTAGLARIVADVPNGSQAVFHAKRVRKAASLLKLDLLGKQLQREASDPTADPSEIIRRIDAMASQLSFSESNSLVTIQDATEQAIERMEQAIQGKDGPALPTGFPTVDSSLGGMFPGELWIVAARPSIGKSAMAVQMAAHSASKDRSVLFVSLEMDAASIATRELAAELGSEVRALRTGAVSPALLDSAKSYASSLSGQPFHIHYGRSITTSRIRGLARLVASRPEGLRLLVVDYMGLITGSDRRRPRYEQVSQISGELKTLAMELQVPVLACCQLGRDAEGKPPTLAQLRDSGSIEQDADVVMLLHRATRDATAASLNIAKNRNGASGEIELQFDSATTSFIDGHNFYSSPFDQEVSQ
jgi:replicative DNA helicase